ncbi:response regulator [Candidatus Halobeggiatoa sp. HSG11]|nr:response regulator [Candidatus Halobeggiatoa sp. HSG11]
MSQGLVAGDLRVTPNTEYNGDFVQIKDSLDTTLSNLKFVVEDIVQISQKLAKGQTVTAQAEYQGDFIQIKTALETAAIKLEEATSKNTTQDWLKTGQTQLGDVVSGEQNMTQLAKNVIALLANYLQMSVGMFYIYEQDKLKLIGSYAYTNRKGIKHEFKTGEGLVGQTALEQKQLHITKVPKDYYVHINSGLGTALPNNLLIQPIIYEGKLKAVIELAAFKTVTETDKLLLTQIMSVIGVAINTAESRSQTQELLQRSRQQTEELQTQQEELQKANGELQSQSEELQSQQEELRQSNETLEERTNDLEQQKIEMEKAQTAITLKAKELELASKYKSEFLANMSHELRTPLNSLLILSQLLAENKTGNLDEKQIEYAETINSAGNDLLTLINDILDLSKVEAGKVEVQWEDISLPNLLASIEQKFAPIANDKNVEFNLTIASDIPDILVTDGQRIKQIINNLLSNALKFTSEGEVKLIVQHPTEIPHYIDKLELGKTIIISVSDTGIGIPKDKQQNIFEAFQQADGSTSRSYGGTGLGLSISRQLARLLGGELTLVSESEKGSTFTLYLPEKQSSLPISQTATSEPPLLMEEYQSPKEVLRSDDRDNLLSTDKTILVIEDDCKFSNILRDLSKNKGFKCLSAEDGLTGLKLAEKHKPSAIILDISLPKMDGLTVMRKLKDKPSTRHIPVHFVSASDQSMDAKKLGAIGYLIKPINIEKLDEVFQKIETFLAKTMKKLLVLADNEANQQKIMSLVANDDLQIEISLTSETACQKLLEMTYDCVILDINVEQNTGSELLKKMYQKKVPACKIPIVVYADRDLTDEEEALLLQCSEEIPIKSADSPEHLVDEISLFLHQIAANLPDNKREMLHMVHDKVTILKNKNVLVVDDDVRNVYALATILENHDMEVVCAVNGKESLKLLKSNPDITIVLMDIMMPEMDGYEAIKEIRKQPKYRNLPIIALTAKAMKDDKNKCIEAGANDYLTKPVDTDKLLSLMRVWLYR